MTDLDLLQLGITNFTQAEIEATGASLGDIQVHLMVTLQKFRTLIGRPVHLLFNGMTTGDHKCPFHLSGDAVDFWVERCGYQRCIKAMFEAGFRGVAGYWNGTAYSYHGDTGEPMRFWKCRIWEDRRVYSELFADPKAA